MSELSVPWAKRNEGDVKGFICTVWRRQKSLRLRKKNGVQYVVSDHSILELSWTSKVISSNSFICS